MLRLAAQAPYRRQPLSSNVRRHKNRMSIFDILVSPGAALGCAIGLGAAVVLHWLFPEEDLLFAQALLIGVFTVAGLIIEYRQSNRHPRP